MAVALPSQEHTDDEPGAARGLLERALSGDPAAFSVWLESEYDFIYRLAYRRLGHRPDAEDLTHIVCLSLPEKLARYSGRGTARGWLARVVLNASLDHRRREKARASETVGADVAHPAGAADRVYLAQVLSALERIAPKSRDALLLVAEGLTHAEIAEALECAEGTVGWHVSSARAQLTAQLDKEGARGSTP